MGEEPWTYLLEYVFPTKEEQKERGKTKKAIEPQE